MSNLAKCVLCLDDEPEKIMRNCKRGNHFVCDWCYRNRTRSSSASPRDAGSCPACPPEPSAAGRRGLRCHACLDDAPWGPFFVCKGAGRHLSCAGCRGPQGSCPGCGGAMGRSRTVEGLAALPHGPRACPVRGCLDRGPTRSMLDHLDRSHGDAAGDWFGFDGLRFFPRFERTGAAGGWKLFVLVTAEDAAGYSVAATAAAGGGDGADLVLSRRCRANPAPAFDRGPAGMDGLFIDDGTAEAAYVPPDEDEEAEGGLGSLPVQIWAEKRVPGGGGGLFRESAMFQVDLLSPLKGTSVRMVG